MITGLQFNTGLFITPLALLPQILYFVERETKIERLKNRLKSFNHNRTLLYLCSHPHWLTNMPQMLGLPVKDVPP